MTTLLWDISQRELGTKQALVDVARAFEELYQKTGDDYAFDDKVVRTYAERIMELYALHHLIHLLGMSPFHEQIMELEITRHFGPQYRPPPQRIDKRDLETLARLIKQNEEVSYGRRKEDERQDPVQRRREEPESEK
jgi:hypothetical protein